MKLKEPIIFSKLKDRIIIHKHIIGSMNSLDSFDICNLDAETEELWFEKFNNIQGGPVSKCLVLIAIMKKQLLISPQEGITFKIFVMKNESKAQLAVDSFCKKKSLYSFRCELRGLLGLPRTRKNDFSKDRKASLSPCFSDRKSILSQNDKSPRKLSPEAFEFKASSIMERRR